MPNKIFSIHGHFYQPPREDPLTGIIPPEAGAAPYNNWNERILAECYLPNARLENFSKISFNVGPTLFSWLRAQDTATYQQILDQDRSNYKKHDRTSIQSHHPTPGLFFRQGYSNHVGNCRLHPPFRSPPARHVAARNRG